MTGGAASFLFLQPDEARPFKPCAKVRKRIETHFSQLVDQLNIMRNYAKQTHVFLTRIIGKVAAFTILQYINKANSRPIGKVKYALG